MVSWPSSYSAGMLMARKFLLEFRVPPGAVNYHSLENYCKIEKELLQVRFEHTIVQLVVAMHAKASC